MIFGIAILFMLALGGVAFAFAGENKPSQKRLAAVAKPSSAVRTRAQADNQQRRKNMTAALKDIDQKSSDLKRKDKLTLRKRLDQAGLTNVANRTFWIGSGVLAAVGAFLSLLTGQTLIVMALVAFGLGFGLPRWTVAFLRSRREKAFTREFAGAIDVIIRSVKTGLPTGEALRIVAREVPDPVGAEFHRLVESMRVGVTLDQAVKKMFESMPTAEVSFFGIVMTIQQKSGGNLSEALGNLSTVLRERKRLHGKIKAMSSEAKASAMIIGSLPIVVMGILYAITPDYIGMLFKERTGNILLLGCGMWMGTGIFVMKKMINFKL